MLIKRSYELSGESSQTHLTKISTVLNRGQMQFWNAQVSTSLTPAARMEKFELKQTNGNDLVIGQTSNTMLTASLYIGGKRGDRSID